MPQKITVFQLRVELAIEEHLPTEEQRDKAWRFLFGQTGPRMLPKLRAMEEAEIRLQQARQAYNRALAR